LHTLDVGVGVGVFVLVGVGIFVGDGVGVFVTEGVGILIVGDGLTGGVIEVAQQLPMLGLAIQAFTNDGIEQYFPPLVAVTQVKPLEQATPFPHTSPQARGAGVAVGLGVLVGSLIGLVGNGVDPGPSVFVQVLEVQLIPAEVQALSQLAPVFTAMYEFPHLHF
jgi:hypothetical protein